MSLTFFDIVRESQRPKAVPGKALSQTRPNAGGARPLFSASEEAKHAHHTLERVTTYCQETLVAPVLV